ncbi:MAG: hypothetical protein Q4B03_03860 [Lachnospiraceae bacterium]|nr:hypothetical protein [Lachnospiraceae bacterium]
MAKIVPFRKKNQAYSDEAYQSLVDLTDLDPDEIYGTHLTNEGVVYRLRLELENSNEEKISEWDPNQWKTLQKYGKVEHSISRTILAPGDMNLHSLHYAIQRLFGWRNSHLHRFYLPQEEFDRLTAGRLDTFFQLCGSLFRFPAELDEEDYWDDDYEFGKDVKAWLRTKYSRPYVNMGPHDTFIVNSLLAGQFVEEHPEFPQGTYLDVVDKNIYFGSPWNTLMESRSLSDLFLMMPDGRERPEPREWKANVLLSTIDLFQDLDEEDTEHSGADLENDYWNNLRPLMAQVDMLPYFSTIYYNYDYGDNWIVKITLEDVYYPDFEFLLDDDYEDDEDWEFDSDSDEFWEEDYESTFEEDADDDDEDIDFDDDEEGFIREMMEMMDDELDYDYLDANRNIISEELVPLLKKVDEGGRPVCVAADGLNVLDDCGGVSGYIRMLEEMNGKNKEEAAEQRNWARSMGWTGRKTKVENML